MRLFPLIYESALHLLAAGALPKLLFDAAHQKKYRKSLSKRLGFSLPRIEKKGKPLVWVHAVSVGELRAALPVIKRLKNLSCPPLVLISNITETGHAEASASAPEADWHLYLPFDFSYLIRPIVKQIAPDLVLISETDFWFHFQNAAKIRGASLVLINGKLSQRSFSRMCRWKTFAQHLIGDFDLLCIQAPVYADRFRQLADESKIALTGNLKLDIPARPLAPEEMLRWKSQVLLGENEPVITLGSTHDPEEKIWMAVLKPLWKDFPNLKVIVAPRHPHRVPEVQKLLTSLHIPFTTWSAPSQQPWQVLVIDTMGELRKCYQTSRLSFVGGSLCSHVGGHNIVEPLFYGSPVLFGPHMHAQPGFLELMKAHQAGIEIKKEEIEKILRHYLRQEKDHKKLVDNGIRLIKQSQGAIERTWGRLEPYLALHQIKSV